MDSKHRETDEAKLVLTPGGPRPAGQTHLVGHGERVVASATGTHIDPGEGGSNALVLTPGGYRHPSLVHQLQHGEGVTRAGGILRKLHLATQTVTDLASPHSSASATAMAFPPASATAATPEGRRPVVSGWITDSSITTTSTTPPIYFFATTWSVPPPPSTQSGQTIFLFNCLMPPAQNAILQPVLQWGPSQAGKGNSWQVTSWYVDASGHAFYRNLVPVNVGDTLIGVMMLTGQSGGTFDYVSLFQGIPGTTLTVSNIPQLTVADETLECYGITKCSDYPNTAFTTMAAIDIKTVGISFAAAGSSLHAYWGSDNSQHVNYLDSDGHIHELYIYPDVPWVNHDLTGFTGGAPAASGSALAGYWGSDNSQHVIYIDKKGHVHELYIRPGIRWVNNDLTAFTHGTPAAPGSSINGYWGADNSQHVNFLDGKGHVHELYIHPGAQWVDNDLTAFSRGTPARNSSGINSYWGSDNSQHVNFVDTNGHIHELYIHPGARWVDIDLTARTKGATAASNSPLSAYWGSDNSQHVNFIDVHHHIHELYIHPGAVWVDNNLTVLASSGARAMDSSRLSGYWGTDNSQHVNYIDTAGHVREMYIHPGARWVDNDLTGFVGGSPLSAPGTGLDSYWGRDNSQHVNFLSADNHVHELYIRPGASWAVNDLSAQGGVNVPIAWGAENRQLECGQKTVILSDQNPGGSVELWYRAN